MEEIKHVVIEVFGFELRNETKVTKTFSRCWKIMKPMEGSESTTFRKVWFGISFKLSIDNLMEQNEPIVTD